MKRQKLTSPGACVSSTGVYPQLNNRRHRTVGHPFQGRYKAVLIQKESHLLEVCRYVVLNPLRAKAVAREES